MLTKNATSTSGRPQTRGLPFSSLPCDYLALTELKHIVDCMREPWRVDVNRKIRILKLLDKEVDNEIKNDFYYKMLLCGHEFSSKSGVTIVQVRRKGVG